MYTTIGKWEPSYLLSDPQGAQVISIPCTPGNGVSNFSKWRNCKCKWWNNK